MAETAKFNKPSVVYYEHLSQKDILGYKSASEKNSVLPICHCDKTSANIRNVVIKRKKIKCFTLLQQ